MKDDSVYLQHILGSAKRVRDYTRDGRDAFLAKTMAQDAVIRNLEIIGEAVKNLSQTVRTANPDVPWKRIAGMRDEVIHRYFELKLDIVWQVVEHHLPALVARVETILASLPSSTTVARTEKESRTMSTP